jgi:hypothetical protein
MGCKEVFGQWVGSKLKYLALICFTIMFTGIFTLGMAIYMSTKLANGQDRIMYHNKVMEIFFLAFVCFVVFVGAILIVFARSDAPSTYPYAIEYPDDIEYSAVNTNVNNINSALLIPNTEYFHIYGI